MNTDSPLHRYLGGDHLLNNGSGSGSWFGFGFLLSSDTQTDDRWPSSGIAKILVFGSRNNVGLIKDPNF